MVPNFLIARLTASFTYYKTSQIQLGSLLQHKHNDFHFFFNSFTSGTSSDSESDGNHHKGDTFTTSYLINSCGVSPKLARELSKRVILKSPDGPNAVLDILKHYGFSKTHVAELVAKRPLVLNAKAEVTLLPKLKFFHSIGISNTDMPKILLGNHSFLMSSLEKYIIPRYEVLRSVVRDEQEAVRALKNAPLAFTYCDITNDLVPNIEVLRQSGVPQAAISLMVVHFSSAAYAKHSKFVDAVKIVKEIGVDPSKTKFVMAVQVVLHMTKAKWESKFELYERWGWNKEMLLQAFRKFPYFLKLSEEAVTKKMSFLVKDIGLPSEDIAEYPAVLAYNFEKRIMPRFSVMKILKSKGLVKETLHIGSFTGIPEEIFLKRFVINFQQDLPFLPDVYRGSINHENVI